MSKELENLRAITEIASEKDPYLREIKLNRIAIHNLEERVRELERKVNERK